MTDVISRDGSKFLPRQREDVPFLAAFKSDRDTRSAVFLNLGFIKDKGRYLSLNMRSYSTAIGLAGRTVQVIGKGQIKFRKREAHTMGKANLSTVNYQPGNVVVMETLQRDGKLIPVGLIGLSDNGAWYGLDLNNLTLITDINTRNEAQGIGDFSFEATVVA